MRRGLVVMGVLVVLSAATSPKTAEAFGLRIGGLSVVETGNDSKFAIGVDNDMRLIRYLAFNTAALYSVDGDSMYIDGYLGLKIFIPIALEGKLELGLRGNFLLKYFYPFDDNASYGLALGGVTGPSIIYDLGVMKVSFDVDIQIYDFVYPSVYDNVGTQVALTYLLGLRF
jgi:hypothetical protein